MQERSRSRLNEMAELRGNFRGSAACLAMEKWQMAQVGEPVY